MEIAYQAVSKFWMDAKQIALVTTEGYFNVSESERWGIKKALEDRGGGRKSNTSTTPYRHRYRTGPFEREDVDAVLRQWNLCHFHCMAGQEGDLEIPEDISVYRVYRRAVIQIRKPTLAICWPARR
jgi:hypothetical protein